MPFFTKAAFYAIITLLKNGEYDRTYRNGIKEYLLMTMLFGAVMGILAGLLMLHASMGASRSFGRPAVSFYHISVMQRNMIKCALRLPKKGQFSAMALLRSYGVGYGHRSVMGKGRGDRMECRGELERMVAPLLVWYEKIRKSCRGERRRRRIIYGFRKLCFNRRAPRR